MNDDERAIRELVETWMAASRAGDTAAVLDLMTDDVLFMTPGREPFGKQAFAADSEAMRGFAFDGRAETLELRVLGDWAWLRNHVEVTLTPPEGEPMRHAGYTLTVLRKEVGRWRVARDAYLEV